MVWGDGDTEREEHWRKMLGDELGSYSYSIGMRAMYRDATDLVEISRRHF